MHFIKRNRILRKSSSIRLLVAETHLSPDDFIVPLFVVEGQGIRSEIYSMPGYYRRSLDFTIREVKELWSMGLKSVLIFIKCEEDKKDNTGR
jgi:porphobilinogen synthase